MNEDLYDRPPQRTVRAFLRFEYTDLPMKIGMMVSIAARPSCTFTPRLLSAENAGTIALRGIYIGQKRQTPVELGSGLPVPMSLQEGPKIFDVCDAGTDITFVVEVVEPIDKISIRLDGEASVGGYEVVEEPLALDRLEDKVCDRT